MSSKPVPPEVQHKVNVLAKFLSILNKFRLVNPFFLAYFYLTFYLKYKVRNALEIKQLNNGILNWAAPALIIANHSSRDDFYVGMGCSARYLRLAKGLVAGRDFENPEYRLYFKYLKMIPRMGTGEEIVKRMARALVERREHVGIMPEGSFSRTGLPMEPFTGFIRVYFEANKDGYKVPIIPNFIKGIAQAYPIKDSWLAKRNLPRKVKITFIFGKAFHLKIPERIDNEILREYANYVMLKVARLGGVDKLRPNKFLDDSRRKGSQRSFEAVDGVDLQ